MILSRLKKAGLYIALLSLISCGSKGYEVYRAQGVSIDSSYDSAYPPGELEAIIKPYRNEVDAQMNGVIGYSDSTLVKYAPESPLGNFAADAVFEFAVKMSPEGFESVTAANTFSLLNFGGLRAPVNKGEITIGNIYELMPFDNRLVFLELDSSALTEMMDYLYDMNGQPAGNVRFILEKNNHKLFVGEKAVDLKTPLYVVTSDYLASGGDKMNFFKKATKSWDSGVLLRDVFIEHVKSKSRIAYPGVNERIKFIR